MKIKPHNLLFLFGFIYYLILPIAVGESNIMVNMPGMDYWYAQFHLLTETEISSYLIIITGYFVFFYLGSFSVRLFILHRKKNILNTKLLNHKTISSPAVEIILLIIIVYLIVINRNILFLGYKTYKGTLLGMLTTINSISLFFLFYSTRTLDRKINLLNVVLTSIILLGLGSRMYVLIPLVSFLIFKLYYSHRRWSIKRIVSYGSLMLVLMLSIGAWRIGHNITPIFLLYLFLAEPNFTWWSSSTYLYSNNLSVVNVPLNYLTSFINFIPSILFEDKKTMIYDISTLHHFEAPLGATSIFVSVQGNFGWYFGMFFMFCVGFYFSIIEKLSYRSKFFFAYYIVISSILPFQFFRDNLAIINKQLFWNTLIVPLVIILLTIFFRQSLATRKMN